MDHRFHIHKKCLLVLLLLLSFGLAVSCSNNAGLASQISGKWQRDQGKGLMEIDLAKEPTTLVMDGHSYHVDVHKIDKMSNTVEVTVDSGNGKSEAWSFHQVWDLNGQSFKLTFRHNGTTETLTHAGQS